MLLGNNRPMDRLDSKEYLTVPFTSAFIIFLLSIVFFVPLLFFFCAVKDAFVSSLCPLREYVRAGELLGHYDVEQCSYGNNIRILNNV